MKLPQLVGVSLVALTTSIFAAASNSSVATTKSTTAAAKMPACDAWTGCDLAKMAKDPMFSQALTFEKDPIGMAAEAKSKQVKAMPLLTQYANQNQCNLYVLAMNDLISGLFKSGGSPEHKAKSKVDARSAKVPQGHGLKITDVSHDPLQKIDFKQNAGASKYIFVEADKARCVKKLGLELPLKTIKGEKKGAK